MAWCRRDCETSDAMKVYFITMEAMKKKMFHFIFDYNYGNSW